MNDGTSVGCAHYDYEAIDYEEHRHEMQDNDTGVR